MNIEAEQAVLCAGLYSGTDDASLTAFRAAAAILEPADFSKKSHTRLYMAMRACLRAGTPIDVVTLRALLDAEGELEAVGGVEYLADLLDVVPTAANVVYHANIVKDRSWKRRVADATTRVQTALLGPDDALADALRGLESVGRAPSGGGRRAEALTLTELASRTDLLVPPDHVLPFGLATRGRITLPAGAPKGGKSTTYAHGVAAFSRGGHFLGRTLKRGKTLWFSADREPPYDILQRFTDLGADPDMIRVVCDFTDAQADFDRLVREDSYDLAVIDTLPNFTVGVVTEPNQSAQWIPVFDDFRRTITDTGVALAVIHHANRANGRYRDSSAIAGAVDAILEFATDATVPNRRSVRTQARYPLKDFAFRLENGVLVPDDGTPSLDGLVMAYIVQMPGLSKSAIVRGMKRNKADVCDSIDRLVRAGALENNGRGNKGAIYAKGGMVPMVPSGSGTGAWGVVPVVNKGTTTPQELPTDVRLEPSGVLSGAVLSGG